MPNQRFQSKKEQLVSKFALRRASNIKKAVIWWEVICIEQLQHHGSPVCFPWMRQRDNNDKAKTVLIDVL